MRFHVRVVHFLFREDEDEAEDDECDDGEEVDDQRRDRNKFAKFLKLLASDDLDPDVKAAWEAIPGNQRKKATRFINTVVQAKGKGKYEIDVAATVVKDPCSVVF